MQRPLRVTLQSSEICRCLWSSARRQNDIIWGSKELASEFQADAARCAATDGVCSSRQFPCDA